tara:strand:+ start:1043 stop:1201 length:159 start_codon:yes stop_codon:yes gene_type:complete
MLEFSKEDFVRLKKEYDQAVSLDKEQFVFDKHILLVSYAKYLIEYLEPKFKK